MMEENVDYIRLAVDHGVNGGDNSGGGGGAKQYV